MPADSEQFRYRARVKASLEAKPSHELAGIDHFSLTTFGCDDLVRNLRLGRYEVEHLIIYFIVHFSRIF